jgi:ornithine carbamoyltransferase
VTLCERLVNGAVRLTQRKPAPRCAIDDARAVNVLLHRQLLSLAPLDAIGQGALLSAARSLRGAGEGPAPLAGKNIALMCRAPAHAAAEAFLDAATRLGARVAQIEPAQPGADMARLIEHLYDAVDCEALPPGFALELQERLSVPVFDGLAREDHPMFALLLSSPGGDDAAIDRRVLRQAALVSTLL